MDMSIHGKMYMYACQNVIKARHLFLFMCTILLCRYQPNGQPQNPGVEDGT